MREGLKNLERVEYLSTLHARDLVERIATRAQNFNHHMSEPEKDAMADLLADIGVKTSDIIDVSNLADNYAINAEIVRPCERNGYNMNQVKEDALFSWQENGKNYYCLSW